MSAPRPAREAAEPPERNLVARRFLQQERATKANMSQLRVKRREADQVARYLPQAIQDYIKSTLPILREANIGIYDEKTGANFRFSYLGDRGYAAPPTQADFQDGVYPDCDAFGGPAKDLVFRPGDVSAIPYSLYEEAESGCFEAHEIVIWTTGQLSTIAFLLIDFNDRDYIIAVSSPKLSSSRVDRTVTVGLSPDDDGATEAEISTKPQRVKGSGTNAIARILVFNKEMLKDTEDQMRSQFSLVSDNAGYNVYLDIHVYKRTFVGDRPQAKYKTPDGGVRMQDMDVAMKVGSEHWAHLNVRGKMGKTTVKPLGNGPIQIIPPKRTLSVRTIALDKKEVVQHAFRQVSRQDYNPDYVMLWDRVLANDRPEEDLGHDIRGDGGDDGAHDGGDDSRNGGPQASGSGDISDGDDSDNDDNGGGDIWGRGHTVQATAPFNRPVKRESTSSATDHQSRIDSLRESRNLDDLAFSDFPDLADDSAMFFSDQPTQAINDDDIVAQQSAILNECLERRSMLRNTPPIGAQHQQGVRPSSVSSSSLKSDDAQQRAIIATLLAEQGSKRIKTEHSTDTGTRLSTPRPRPSTPLRCSMAATPARSTPARSTPHSTGATPRPSGSPLGRRGVSGSPFIGSGRSCGG